MFQLQFYMQKSGKYWAVECPALQAVTQGKTKKDAVAMAMAWVRDMLDNQEFDIAASKVLPDGSFHLSFSDYQPILKMMYERARSTAGLRVEDVAHRLGRTKGTVSTFIGAKSHPRLDKMIEMANALDSDIEIHIVPRANKLA